MTANEYYLPRKGIIEATEKFATPFFLYDEQRLRQNCRRFKGAFGKYFDDFQPLFAVKANPNPRVLEIVAQEGFGMDASSEPEVWLSHKLGLSGMYTANYTTADQLQYAHERGFLLNLDDISNVPMVPSNPPEVLSFRINPGLGSATEESCVTAGPNAKYGIPHERAVDAYKLALDANVRRFGIHMMTGSNVPMKEVDYFADVVAKLLDIVARLKQKLGIEVEFMNMGGGFGVPYEPDQAPLDLDHVAKSVKEVMDAKCNEHGLQQPRLMAEPGRIIAADAGWLVTKVTVIKDSYKRFVGVDASSNDMPRPSIYGAYHHVTVLNDAKQTEQVSVVGSICENNDQFARDRELPVCSVGDVVALHHCGAHAYAMGHNYNGKLRHAEYLLPENGDAFLIRRAETFEDYFRTVDV